MGGAGAAWVFARSNGVWTQQGGKLLSADAVGLAQQGTSVALSADGSTAIVSGPYDNSSAGAVWVYTGCGGVWTQQGSKLVGSGAGSSGTLFGAAVALSGDGNTAIVGAPFDSGVGVLDSDQGAAWIFTRVGGVWTQQGNKLVGIGDVPHDGPEQGYSVALSGNGNTALIGSPQSDLGAGGAWVFTRSRGVWSQHGGLLVGANPSGAHSLQGQSLALSGDGNTVMLGGPSDNSALGASWVFAQPAPLSLQVSPINNIVSAGNPGGPFAPSSFQYQLSANGGTANYAITGVPSWLTASTTSGAASLGTTVTFTANSNATGLSQTTCAPITFTNSDTGLGTQTRYATLVINPPGLQLSPAANIVASGQHGGPLSPSSFHYDLSATYSSVKYTVTTPSWLNASSKSGTVTTSPKTITFTVSSNAHSLQPNTYVGSVGITNTTNGQGNTSRVGTLTVNPKDYKLTVSASPTGDGSVAGGGEVAEATSATVTATANSGFHFVQWTENGKEVSTSASYTFTMPSKAITLVAHFQ